MRADGSSQRNYARTVGAMSERGASNFVSRTVAEGNAADVAQSPKRTYKGTIDWTARIQAVCAMLLVAITGVYTWYTRNQVRAVYEAETFDNRPWLKIADVGLAPGRGPLKTLMFHNPLTKGPQAPFLQLRISIRNIGKSVARDVIIEPFFVPVAFDTNGFYQRATDQERIWCDSTAKSYEKDASPSIIVFPEDGYEFHGGSGGIPVSGDNENGVVVVCVTYRGDPGTKYQTQAWAQLVEGKNEFLLRGVDADIATLKLLRQPNGDHAY